jgi:hypothetical protein
VSDSGQDWLDKHEAARISGYNARTLTNKAAAGEIRAEQRIDARRGQGVVLLAC